MPIITEILYSVIVILIKKNHENSEECVIIIFSSFVEEIHEGIKLKGNFDVVAGSVVNYFCEAKIQLSQKKELSKVFSELLQQHMTMVF